MLRQTHELPSSWDVWTTSRRLDQKRGSESAVLDGEGPCVAGQAVQVWHGLGVKQRANPSLDSDLTLKKSVALEAVRLALSWGDHGTLGQQSDRQGA